MSKPLFSVVLIVRNEGKTLPRLLESLKEFFERCGECIILDTGSTDNTSEVAKSFGCKLYEVNDKFVAHIGRELAHIINDNFVCDGEANVVNDGDKVFDFSSARNYASSLSSNDMICMPDADEKYTKFDINKINDAILNGAEQLEYNFVFSHDQYGNESVKFRHCKFYNRSKQQWVGVIHEVLSGESNRVFLEEDTIKLEHWQNPETNRGGYLKGLALDCYTNPDNDRNSHYFGRELMYTGRHRSAIKELQRHVDMNRWPAERAQSIIYMGDCYGHIGDKGKQREMYQQAFDIDSSRREALIKLAYYYLFYKNYQAALSFSVAAMEIPYTDYYGNDMSHYRDVPHHVAYTCLGWLGRIDEARKHNNKCLEYQPDNSEYLRDNRFYNKLPTVSFIIPQLGREEGLKRCIDSIKALNYPQELIDIKVIEGEETVPVKIKKGVEETAGEYIVFAANDLEFDTDDLIKAVTLADDTCALVIFNTGAPNECEHFMVRRKVIPLLSNQELFDTRFHHCGCDNWLMHQLKELHKKGPGMDGGPSFQVKYAPNTKTKHYHFSRGGQMDSIYQKGWSHVEQDRALLRELMSII